MLVSAIAVLGALAIAGADDVCVCVAESECVDGRIRDASTLEDAHPEDFHNGEGLISERIRVCDWEQTCCTVPPHIRVPDLPATTSKTKETDDNSSEESDESKESEESSEEDDLELPRTGELKGCGVKRSPPLKLPIDLRISGLKGPEKTFYGEVPWMVRILDGKKFVCGGSLITPKVVLTAAHCLKRIRGGPLIAEVGEWDTKSKKELLPPQRLEATKVVKHSDFNSTNLNNDVALAFFKEPFIVSETVDIICTPESFKDVDGRYCVAAGWGKADESKSAPYQAVLRKVQLPLMDHDTCESRLKETRLGPDFRLLPGFVCAGGTVDGDTCAGDGGGPLYCPLIADPNRMAVVGVTAWGIECGKGNPAVFASVPDQMSWIYTTISSELEDD